jgi:isopentenyl diphosphate isomerase/L-lactate dehydrogenase-like FMN-dependent dehydrogenase
MGGSALVAYQGHTVMAKAAAEAKIPLVLSANSIIPLEEVVRANPNAWFAASAWACQRDKPLSRGKLRPKAVASSAWRCNPLDSRRQIGNRPSAQLIVQHGPDPMSMAVGVC